MTNPRSPDPSPVVSDVSTSIGPVSSHRIAQIRRRIRDGRYALDSRSVAAEIARHDGIESTAPGSIGRTVEHRLSIAIDRLDHNAALILQLEFVEQLDAVEIAVTIGTGAGELAVVRSAALLKLKTLLDAEQLYR